MITMAPLFPKAQNLSFHLFHIQKLITKKRNVIHFSFIIDSLGRQIRNFLVHHPLPFQHFLLRN